MSSKLFLVGLLASVAAIASAEEYDYYSYVNPWAAPAAGSDDSDSWWDVTTRAPAPSSWDNNRNRNDQWGNNNNNNNNDWDNWNSPSSDNWQAPAVQAAPQQSRMPASSSGNWGSMSSSGGCRASTCSCYTQCGPPGPPGPDNRGPPGFQGPQGDQGPPGDRGEPGRSGNPGTPGSPGRPGPAGDDGPAGMCGPDGPPGEMGRAGKMGPSGPQGPPGTPGALGTPGRNGIPGCNGTVGRPGPAGPDGAPGPKGPRGPRGPDGRPGAPGDMGREGRPGQPGRAGGSGLASEGAPGPSGAPGSPGPQGPSGPDGDCGAPGRPGADGRKGPPGPKGPKGRAGSVSTPGCLTNSVYARHSQTTEAPQCPNGHMKLWDGFSLLHTEDEARANVQDLGRSGSCLRQFEVMPFMFCGSNGVCNWGARTATSYWLASETRQQYIGLYGLDDSREQPLTREDDIIRQISRCSVCFACGPVITIHSQNATVPSCPDEKWNSLWTGYSFTMHSVGAMGGGQMLDSPGSCLPSFRHHPYIECTATGQCAYYSEKTSYWLVARDQVPSKMPGVGESTFSKARDDVMRTVGRCRVCSQDIGIQM